MAPRTMLYTEVTGVLEDGPKTSRQIATILSKPEHAIVACLRGMQYRQDVVKMKASKGEMLFRWRLA